MRVFLNLFGGVAGDMLVAGLLDAGADPLGERGDLVRPALAELGVRWQAVPDQRHGLQGTRLQVQTAPTQAHRHLAEILQILERLPLSERAAAWARSAFQHLAQAEASIHGCCIEEVHFHEVGAADAIADIALACHLMDALDPSSIHASSIPVGSGTVRCAHGVMPVPAPATRLLLEDMPTCGFELEGERATPTGVALLKAWQVDFRPRSAALCLRSGLGLGSRDPQDRANLLRVELEQAACPSEWLVELRCLVDDLSGELIGDALEQLRAAGALEAYAVAAMGKKSRPAFEVVVLCEVPRQQEFEDLCFRLLGTLGLRVAPLHRRTLEREEGVDARHGLSVKQRTLPDGGHAGKIEFEDLRARAEVEGLTPRELLMRLQEEPSG